MANILIIEDDRWFRKLLCDCLSEAGHRCYELHRGDNAVRLARQALKKGRALDLAIVDGWYLPGKLGANVCREFRDDPLFKQLPLMVLSVEGWEAIEAQLGGIKIDRFMRKPVHFQDVVSTVKELLSRPQASKRKSV